MLPPPAKATLQLKPLVDPVITIDPPPPEASRIDERPAKTDAVAAVGRQREDVVHEVARVLARAARIDAGAAQCRPAYPGAAQRVGAAGVTRIRFSVDANGRIADSRILQSSGPTREHRLLDRAGAEALAQCPVQVGTDEAGHPVGTTTDVEYVWTLN